MLRNSRGEAIAGTSKLIDHVFNSQTAETLALLQGLKLLSEIGCTKVTVESNCLELIEARSGKIEILGPNVAILADCFHIAHEIPGICFKHCPSEANGLAHFLARYSYDVNSSFVWADVAPSFLLSHVLTVLRASYTVAAKNVRTR